MATITLRGDLQWRAQVRRQGHPPQSKTFMVKADAEAWARKIESEIERGIWRDSSESERTTLADAIDRYLAEKTPLHRGAAGERPRLLALRREKFALLALARVDGKALVKWRDKELANGLTPGTVRRKMGIISAIFETARKEWGMPALLNPVKAVGRPKVNDARERRLEDGEEERLLSTLANSGKPDGKRNPWMLPLVKFAIETAGRQSELLSLVWADINLLKKTCRLRGVEGRQTKNSDAFREIPLSSAAVKVLKAIPRSIGGRVFPTTASAVKQSWARACKRAGIEDLHFHDLRHEATSRLAEKLAVHELTKVTGHKDMRMLMRYYHPRAEDLARKLA